MMNGLSATVALIMIGESVVTSPQVASSPILHALVATSLSIVTLPLVAISLIIVECQPPS